jgi:hypothetical protein
MSVRLKSFQRLALWTTATTYLLILVGGLVRASGAGLGVPTGRAVSARGSRRRRPLISRRSSIHHSSIRR